MMATDRAVALGKETVMTKKLWLALTNLVRLSHLQAPNPRLVSITKSIRVHSVSHQKAMRP
jgi:hypothetical protein